MPEQPLPGRFPNGDNLFTAIHAGGIVYCDKSKEEHGDYMKVAMLPYDTLILRTYKPFHPLMPLIREDAERIMLRRGQRFQISSTGQTVILGQ